MVARRNPLECTNAGRITERNGGKASKTATMRRSALDVSDEAGEHVVRSFVVLP